MIVEHHFERAMPYAWGGYRFVCSCGQSGSVVPDIRAAVAEHGRHADAERAKANVVRDAIHQAKGYIAGDHGWDAGPFEAWWAANAGRFDENSTLARLVAAGAILDNRQAVSA